MPILKERCMEEGKYAFQTWFVKINVAQKMSSKNDHDSSSVLFI